MSRFIIVRRKLDSALGTGHEDQAVNNYKTKSVKEIDFKELGQCDN